MHKRLLCFIQFYCPRHASLEYFRRAMCLLGRQPSRNSLESCGTWKLARFSVTVVINSVKSNFDAEFKVNPARWLLGETSRVKRRGRRAGLADCKLYATCLLYISSAHNFPLS